MMRGWRDRGRRQLDRLSRLDWRIWAVVLTVAISLVLTVAGYAFRLHVDPASHFGSVFASWVGGVVLFTLAGSIISIISLIRPEHDSFDARARILFRRQQGSHIDYIITRLPDIFEHYAESSNRKIIVDQYHADCMMFRVAIETETLVRSFVDDIDSTYRSDFKMTASPPPAGRPSNRLVYLRVNGRPEGAGEEFSTDVERPFETVIGPGGSCLVENFFEVWVKCTEELNRHRPARYTRRMQMKVENRLSNMPIIIRTRDGSETRVLPGTTRVLAEARDVKPQEAFYEFYMLTG